MTDPADNIRSNRLIVDREGRPFPIGPELGRGGEGVVFEVTGQPGLVAKLYHEPPSALKQDKLRLMAAGVDDRLRRYAAWPEATLHRESDQAVVGFVMQRIEHRLPIHMLYSPAQRRKLFPKARFDFLVFVARNIAAAFDTLHDHGHVLGDVNQGNVLVGADSQVILIDCDSFQVRFGEALHRCEVGVAHFTPPELQRVRAFETTTRTPNHDCFGLALLIFHLLMGGRHPFSGVPQSERVGQALEADIRDFRYAYARDARQRLLLPPPRSVPVDILPAEIRAMFELAFLESGSRQRPSAEQWVQSLDQLRMQLKPCAHQSQHVYPGDLASCCWCALESQQVALFGARRASASRSSAALPTFDLRGIKQELAKLKTPELVSVPKPFALPAQGAQRSKLWLLWGGPALGAAAFFAMAMLQEPMSRSGFITVAVLLAILTAAAQVAIKTLESWQADHLRQLLVAYQSVCVELDTLAAEINAQRGAQAFAGAREALEALIRRYEHMRSSGLDALARSVKEREDIALQRFLQRTKIEQFPERHITTLARARLLNLGVNSAAELSAERLSSLAMTHPELCQKLLDWRRDLSVQFRQQYASTSKSTQMIRRQHLTQLTQLEQEVRDAWQHLRAIKVGTGSTSKSENIRMQTLLNRRLAIYQEYCRQLLQ